ncbi:MAG TPA: PP2C family protein-serine/threonine phosphatase [Acidimicrobiales bacterium]
MDDTPTTTPDGDVFMDLALASSGLPPDGLVPVVSNAAARLGGRDAEVWLVDLSQRRLNHLSPSGERALPPRPVDGTAPGSAYRSVQPLEVPAGGRGRRLWIPILDAAERLGVLGVTVDGPVLDADQPGTLRRWTALASRVGELVVSKSGYGDVIALARRTDGVSLAAEMRWTMLPPLTFASPGVTVSGILEPAYDIAGDCFDYAVNRDVVHVALLDAIGHGLEASHMANLAIAGYRNLRRAGVGLGETVMSLDRLIAQQFGEQRFITGQIATLDHSSGVLRMVNAGHPRPLLVRRGRDLGDVPCEPCRPVGLGAVPTTTTDVALEPGDAVLFHTDGVTESRSADGTFFGRDRLADLVVRRMAGGDTPAEVLRQVVHAVLEHEDQRLRDDATLVMLEWQGARSNDRLADLRGGRSHGS